MFSGWFHQFQTFFAHYGLWAVFFILLLENAGLPLPGEFTLLYASYVAHQERALSLPTVMLTGFCACVLGDNTGFWLAREAGAWLKRVLRLTPARLEYAHHYFRKFGKMTIFFARFIAGLRIIAGPAAGLEGFSWESFLLFNALGAAAWVTAISSAGYLLGHHWQHLLLLIKRVDYGILALAIVAAILIVRHIRHERTRGASS